MNWLNTQTNSEEQTAQTAQFDFIEKEITPKIKEAIFSSSQELNTSTKIEIDIPEGLYLDLDHFNLSTVSTGMRNMPNYYALVRILLQSQTQMNAKFHEPTRKLFLLLNWEVPSMN